MSGAEARRVALVTGGGRGIGREISRRLAGDGLTVVIADIDREGAGTAAAEIGGDATAVEVDIGDEASVASMFAGIDKVFGRLDVLINNAGIVLRPNDRSPRIEETSLDTWRRSMDVNLTGVFIVSRAAIPLLRKSETGRVVTISSLVGQAYSDQSGYYAAAKAGVLGFSRILAGELGACGVTVNCIAPGMIRTPAIDRSPDAAERYAAYGATAVLRRPGEMADVAAAVSFLVSPGAGYITGEILNVNGGAFMP